MPVTLQPPIDKDETDFIPFYNYVAMLNVSVLKQFLLHLLYLFYMQCFQNIHPKFGH